MIFGILTSLSMGAYLTVFLTNGFGIRFLLINEVDKMFGFRTVALGPTNPGNEVETGSLECKLYFITLINMRTRGKKGCLAFMVLTSPKPASVPKNSLRLVRSYRNHNQSTKRNSNCGNNVNNVK